MDLKEKAWRFQQESLAACHSLWNIHSPMYIFTSVSWEKRSFGQSLELSQFQQFGKQTKNKGLWIYLHTRTTWQLWTRPGVSSAPQLFCSPKLVDQSAKGEKKPKRNKNQTTHEVILTVSLNLILCKSTAQLWTFSQVSILSLVFIFGFLCMAGTVGANWSSDKKWPVSQPFWRKSLVFMKFKESRAAGLTLAPGNQPNVTGLLG